MSKTTVRLDVREDIRNGREPFGKIMQTVASLKDSEQLLGGHASWRWGYDRIRKRYIVRNSWGTGWGEAGFFRIAYSEVTGTSRFAYSTMVYDGPQTDWGRLDAYASAPAKQSESFRRAAHAGRLHPG